MVNVIESHVELRVKSVEDMVNVIESYVELRVKSVEEMVYTEWITRSFVSKANEGGHVRIYRYIHNLKVYYCLLLL
jgi:hypothetical protein